MSFVEKYTHAKGSRDKSKFMERKMLVELYDFLWDHGAFPNENQKFATTRQTDYAPWNDDIYTAYKTILYTATLEHLHSKVGDHALTLINIGEAVEKIYEMRNLKPPQYTSEISIAIEDISRGYADALRSAIEQKSAGVGSP